MKPGLLQLFLPLIALLGAEPVAHAAASETNRPGRLDYPSFHIITERNIFDPHRSGRGTRSAPREDSSRRVQAETFALLGTMSYEKGRFAFFDGTGSQYRKVLQSTDSIAGFKIAEVAPTCVKLETTNGQVLELCVGMQMKHRDEDGWYLAGSASESSGPASTSSHGPAPGESEDVLKRLLAQREKDGGSTENTPAPPAVEEKKPDDKSSADEGDEVLKRLLQKREQELNK